MLEEMAEAPAASETGSGLCCSRARHPNWASSEAPMEQTVRGHGGPS